MSDPQKPLPIKPTEWAAALAMFLVPALAAILGVIDNTGGIPGWAGPLMVVLFLGSISVPLIWAIVKGFPRWSVGYLGPLLLGVVFFGPFVQLIAWIYGFLVPLFGPLRNWSLTGRILYSGALSAIVWLLVLLAAFLLVSLLRLWPHTSSVWERVREDRTQLSFILYGGLVFHIEMIFDEYQGRAPWMVAAWLALGIGCWFYLRVRDPKRRLVILIAGVTLAMWLVAVGKWTLVPSQNWHPFLENYPPDSERWFAFWGTLVDWLVLSGVMLIPSILNRSRQAPKTLPDEAGLTGVS